MIAYCLANVIHEAAGHGVACVLVGGHPVRLDSMSFSCAEESVSPGGLRLLAAGGTVANLIVAAVILTTRRAAERWSPAARYFLWLFLAVNVLTAFGYLLFSGVGNIGDWAMVIKGLPVAWLWRLGEIAVGGVLYFVVAPCLLWPGLVPFLGSDPPQRVARLTVFPYWIGGITFLVSSAFNPNGIQFVLLAGAAAFGGTSLLAWYFTNRTQHSTGLDSEAIGIPRSLAWIVAATVTFAIFVGALGRGISL